jgi:hypothetical protein
MEGYFRLKHSKHEKEDTIFCSVRDPDPYVFGPPGSASGSVSHKYGSNSASIKK